MKKLCELYDRECIDCGECGVCDLDNSKKCNNCGQCIEETKVTRSVNISDFMKKSKN